MNNLNDIWQHYYAPRLTGHELNQLSKAKPSQMLEQIIKPMVLDRSFYLCVSDSPNVEDRNQHSAHSLAHGLKDWSMQSLFTNALSYPRDGLKPKQRVTIAPHVILTFEFDSDDLSFFKEQLSWMRSARKPQHSKLGQFVTELRQTYADFAGLSVVYSGSKSFHFHFAFRTNAINDPTDLRDGYIRSWSKLSKMFVEAMGTSEQPDPALRLPESFRRLPDGYRLLSKPTMFGLSTNDVIKQVTIFEMMVSRSSSQTSFFDPADFATPIMKAVSRSTSASLSMIDTGPVADFIKEKMDAIFTDYPKFAGFTEAKGKLRAQFWNGPSDKNPSSYIEEGYRTIMMQGRTLTAGPVPMLPASLSEMLDQWLAEYDAIESLKPTGFEAKATDKASAIEAMADVLNDVMRGPSRKTMLVAPEGISKSRTLLQNTPSYIHLNDDGLMMFAFATYAAAEEKAAEFGAMHPQDQSRFGRTFKPIVLKSFSRIYEDSCRQLGVRALTIKDVVAFGCSSLEECIREYQAEVMDMVESYYRSIQTIHTPVLFTVHAVAQDWIKNGPSRLMFSPHFWNGDAYKAREATRLSILIHDEATDSDLLTMAPDDHLRFVESLGLKAGQSLAEQFLIYEAAVSAPTTFSEAQVIHQTKNFETYTLTYNQEYGPRHSHDIYEGCAGQVWHIAERDWSIAARKVLVLTTEATPSLIAKKQGWEVIELSTPLIEPDAVEVRPSRGVTASNVSKIAAQIRAEFPNITVIGNKLSHISQTQTHHSAKGSNGFIGQDLAQTILMMAPTQYERCEALNSYLDRSDMVRIRHMDDFNQTAGRNRGFRASDPEPVHVVLLSQKLWDALAPVLWRSRYAFDVVNTRTRASKKITLQKPISMMDSREQMKAIRAKLLESSRT